MAHAPEEPVQSDEAGSRQGEEPTSRLVAWFADPVAEHTEWTPLVTRGMNRRTHRLVQASASRWEMRPLTSLRIICAIFCVLFVTMGAVLAAVGLLGLYRLAQASWPGLGAIALLLAFLFGGVLLAWVGVWQFRWLCRPRVFDLKANWFWSGKRPRDDANRTASERSAPLEQVHAVQIVAELVSGTKSTNFRDFKSYEINLVMHDGHRVNVVDHGYLKHIRKDAETIAELIGVPVWDATMRWGAAPRD